MGKKVIKIKKSLQKEENKPNKKQTKNIKNKQKTNTKNKNKTKQKCTFHTKCVLSKALVGRFYLCFLNLESFALSKFHISVAIIRQRDSIGILLCNV